MEIMVNKIDSVGQSRLSGIRPKNEQRTSESEYSTNIKITKDNIENLVDTLNSAAKSIDKRVTFSINEKANRVIMKVFDAQSNEVIREIPPKEMIRLLESIHEFIGMFVDESR
ncbi:MAG: flagellar protein FlaG [Spirochaetota bacterium]|nr:flagellar protein FlaG [Spirochaetota bacterium]